MSDYVAPDFYNQFSLMLSAALDDIGVNMKTVNMRRRLQLALEKILDIQEKLTSSLAAEVAAAEASSQ
ncbi:hypothetical protein DPMN_127994 [Dreissena polymorpha]|uniref:Uncharacterized protein n=1 Tax=Dreissena polymorpha TaxID=45954 RepID=A0A9D4JVZ2_DREPO|nr:hypothetical protein DPMN_127994 [Dreissena polymorpha]